MVVGLRGREGDVVDVVHGSWDGGVVEVGEPSIQWIRRGKWYSLRNCVRVVLMILRSVSSVCEASYDTVFKYVCLRVRL